MKHTKVVSKCCGAEFKRITIAISGGGYRSDNMCVKCSKPCDTQTITLTPDSEIREVLKANMFYTEKIPMGKTTNNRIRKIAEQLNIPLDEK